jgi:chitinase
VCLGVASASCVRNDDEAAVASRSQRVASSPHRFCGWLQGKQRDPAFTERAYDTFARNAAEFDAVHPVWWRVASPTTLTNRPHGRDAPYAGFHDARVLDQTTSRGGRTRLVPTIEATERPDIVHAHTMINDPELRRRHVDAVVDLVVSNGYDGIDIDYEHLDPDHLGEDMRPGQSVHTERQAFSAFVGELSRALHGAGRTLSLALPVAHGPGGTYDYDALSAAADVIHVMGYDFHYEAGPHIGPLAPLGWIERSVAYIGEIDGGRRRDRFLLGLPNYGIVEPPGAPIEVCQPSTACLELVGGSYATTTQHMEHCRGPGRPVIAPGRAPNAELPDGARVFFEDLASLEEKTRAAARGGLGGVSYWKIGGEPEAFFEMVRRHFPR